MWRVAVGGWVFRDDVCYEEERGAPPVPWTLRPRRLGKDAFERPAMAARAEGRVAAWMMPEVGEGGEAFDERWGC